MTVRALIGEGGQGAVFEADLDDGSPVAMKWYLPHCATPAQRQAISLLVDLEAPSDRFLWPQEMVAVEGDPSFGYVMALRPPTYVGMVDLLSGRVDVSVENLCTVGYELADSFLKLHNLGYCYRDVSYGNVFLEPTTGRVLICDNDNVGIDGMSTSNVLGTRRFMAPEIVRGDAIPTISTDQYSLSVLLFYLLMVGHPLLGRHELDHAALDVAAERELFGVAPRFVFDPEDSSNAPVPGVHDAVIANWRYYTTAIRELFTQAFTDGLADPQHGRVRESVWRLAMARLRDQIMPCPHCGRTNLYDEADPERACWSCHRPMSRPLRLRVGHESVVLRQGTSLYAHHLRLDHDFETRLAVIAPHPERPDVYGLRNLTDRAWTVSLPDGEQREVAPQRSIGLIPGATVDLDGVQAGFEL